MFNASLLPSLPLKGWFNKGVVVCEGMEQDTVQETSMNTPDVLEVVVTRDYPQGNTTVEKQPVLVSQAINLGAYFLIRRVLSTFLNTYDKNTNLAIMASDEKGIITIVKEPVRAYFRNPDNLRAFYEKQQEGVAAYIKRRRKAPEIKELLTEMLDGTHPYAQTFFEGRRAKGGESLAQAYRAIFHSLQDRL
jgi:hypothetical protein